MREDVARSSVRFEPLHPATRSNLFTGVVIGPLLWLVVLALGAWVFEYSWAIALGLLVVVVSFVVALIVLSLLWAWRVRQEKRYVDSR
jgi:Flp pilus assembly protein TadB